LSIGFEVKEIVKDNHGGRGRQTQYWLNNTDFVMLNDKSKA